MKILTRILSILCLFPLLACGSGGEPVPIATGILYVLDRANKAVYVLDHIDDLDGGTDPVRTITGDNTLLQSPAALTVDGRRDVLYVAETSSEQVLAFIPASQNDGNVSPRRTYPGLNRASGLFIDVSNNRLYAADAIDRSIKAWDEISTLPSGTAPNRTIPLGYEPSALFVDAQRDLLYVGDPAAGSIKVYVNASSLGVAAPPDSEIMDATNPFLDIRSIAINVPNNLLFVADDFIPSVEIFLQASTVDGSVVPDRSLQGGSTGLTFDIGQVLFVDNVLYQQLSRTQVGIWNDANTVGGDTAPNRRVTVNPATLIVGIAVDLAH